MEAYDGPQIVGIDLHPARVGAGPDGREWPEAGNHLRGPAS